MTDLENKAKEYASIMIHYEDTKIYGERNRLIKSYIDGYEQGVKDSEVPKKLSEPEAAKAFQNWITETRINELKGTVGMDNVMFWLQEAFAAGIRSCK